MPDGLVTPLLALIDRVDRPLADGHDTIAIGGNKR